MEVRLLGEVVVLAGGRPVDLGPARQRCVWAALALDANRVVPVERLVERVWDEPPLRARAVLTSYVSRLRQALAGHDGAVGLVRRSGGYLLEADESVIDLHRFRALAARTGDVDALTGALALWRGEPLAGLSGPWVEAERDRLRQERLAAEHDLVDARLAAGQGAELVAELAARAAEHPLDERVAGQYLLALHRAGRTADALAHYRLVERRLARDLGTDPGPALRELHRRLRDTDPDPDPDTAPPVATGPVPRQLPAAPPHFTGRDAELTALTAAAERGGAVVISAITGAGGIGKTWLALHWAHRNLHRFPDGQLFVDLRGFSPDSEPMDPAVAVRGFLDALGVPPGRQPADPSAQTALFHELAAGKRMLLVLDNAAGAAQAAPLLPGGSTCTVLVTSRSRTAAAVAGRELALGVLDDTEARDLLTAKLGAGRTAAEPAAVTELIRLCGGFPLALGIVAGHAHTRPHLPLSVVAADLRDLGLAALEDSDPTASLPAVLSWSLRALTPDQRRAYALLGTAPGPDIGLPAAASLVGLPRDEAAAVLAALEHASLLTRDGHDRHRMHDLIRAHAADTAHDLPEPERDAALRRLLDFYLHTADAADRAVYPSRGTLALDPPAPGVHPHPDFDPATAMAWFDAEHPNLLAAHHHAAARGRHRTTWDLARSLHSYHQRRGHLHDRITVWRAALAAAAHLPDPGALIQAHRLLGTAQALLGRHEEAFEHMHRALALAEEHRDPTHQAHTHRMLALAWERQGDDRRALEHITRSLHLHRALGQPVLEADALNAVGWYHARLGDYDTAREHCLAALALQRDQADDGAVANTLDSLGYIDHRTGRHAEAVEHYRQALDRYRELGITYEYTDTLDRLGHPHAALGQRDRAREVWREALRLYRHQDRDTDADRVRRQLDELDGRPG
ncbi:AfsR/SARP family transcriptional regulator [Saccharothrix syringae]|uniref:AfsR/SARP family transcriptional regulator n=2 Tax=Saccharothrix syringae TaxID=103733 RepID=UPI002AD4E201|nr:BTAD domain-containing putative transcriptional regulator [Saccharothrix syringae]